jgi:signal transduction histidine kinase
MAMPAMLEEVKLGSSREPLSSADVNLLRRADAAGQRLFRELVGRRITWSTVGEVNRLIAADVVAVSIPAPGCEHPRPCRQLRCQDQLEMKAVLGNRAARLPGLVLAPGAGVGGRVLQTGRAFSVSHYHEASFDGELIELAREEGIASLLAVPISFAGVVRGVLHVGLRRPGGFGPGVAEALSRVATYAGAAFAAAADRARVEELARLRERRRLVRALHDDLGQQLFGVGVQARRARESATTGNPDLMTHLHELEGQVARASGALRATMNGLAPQQAQASSLALVLAEDLAAFQGRTALPAHLLVLDEPAPLPPAPVDLLARVAREGLRNVERHAQASEVVVTLRVDDGAAELTVQDDGVGCRGGLRPGRLGLRSLREEVEKLGGELRLTANDDVGATLRVCLPRE